MKELTLKATVENIAAVTAFVDEALEEWACPVKAQLQIDMAVDELFCNIASYAYSSGEGDATVQVDFDASDRTVSLVFMDRGKPFDPLSVDTPDTTSSVEDRRIGGLGIFLVRKTMDGMEYQRDGDVNKLTIRKRI